MLTEREPKRRTLSKYIIINETILRCKRFYYFDAFAINFDIILSSLPENNELLYVKYKEQ